MLVLSRQRRQRIVIGDGQITLTVVAIDGGRVRLGIEAPESVRVDREEVHRRRLRSFANYHQENGNGRHTQEKENQAASPQTDSNG